MKNRPFYTRRELTKMIEAEFVKTLTIPAPASEEGGEYEDYVTLEVYQDPNTGNYFALDATYLQSNPNMIMVSPYSRSQLRVVV